MKWIIPIAAGVLTLSACTSTAPKTEDKLAKKHRDLTFAHIDLQENYEAQQSWMNRYEALLDGVNEDHQLWASTSDTQGPASLDKRLNILAEHFHLDAQELEQLKMRLKKETENGESLRNQLTAASKQEKAYLFALENAESTIDEMMAALDEEMALADLLIADLEAAKIKTQEAHDALNEVRLAYGTRKELKAYGLAKRKGGIAGIGGALVSTSGDAASYTVLDKRLTTSIPLPAERCKLLSEHPAESYEWMREDGQSILVITEPETFWEHSKTLTAVLL